MPSDAKLLALVGVLHLVMLVLAGIMLFLFIRSDTNGTVPPRPDEGEGGGGGNDRLPPRAPAGPRDGGLPLPDAEPAAVRLRGPGRLRDTRTRPSRRPAHPPAPRRTPARTPR
ncbi:MAG: hypothetical protein U0R70_00580 [Solirubrobacteraceae bacterium]